MGILQDAFDVTNRFKYPIMAGAALLALHQSHMHPFKAALDSVSYATTGDPTAIGKFAKFNMMGGIVNSLNDVGIPAYPSFIQPGVSNISHEQIANYYGGPNPNPENNLYFREMALAEPPEDFIRPRRRGRNPYAYNNGPSGNIVMGMYNNRLRRTF